MERNKWELNYKKEISHKKEITCIQWVNDEVFATAGLDKTIKIWDKNTMKLINYINTDKEIT